MFWYQLYFSFMRNDRTFTYIDYYLYFINKNSFCAFHVCCLFLFFPLLSFPLHCCSRIALRWGGYYGIYQSASHCDSKMRVFLLISLGPCSACNMGLFMKGRRRISVAVESQISERRGFEFPFFFFFFLFILRLQMWLKQGSDVYCRNNSGLYVFIEKRSDKTSLQ